MNNLQWQPDKIESYLNLVFLGIMAIANLDSEAIIQAVKNLNLDRIVKERITLWQSRSNSINITSESVKKLDVEEALSLVMVICYLAQQNQELLRRAVSLLEQTIKENNPPQKTVLLGNYLDRFVDYNKEIIIFISDINTEYLPNLAWKLLIDLLFYTSKNGHHLLWDVMLNARKVYN